MSRALGVRDMRFPAPVAAELKVWDGMLMDVGSGGLGGPLKPVIVKNAGL